MALVVDSGALIALYDGKDPLHRRIVDSISDRSGLLIVPVLAITEAVYLLGKVGLTAQQALLNDLENGPFQVEGVLPQDFRRTSQLMMQYADLSLDFVDAALVACAERLGIQRIATVDLRDFRVIRSANGKPFTLVPWDD